MFFKDRDDTLQKMQEGKPVEANTVYVAAGYPTETISKLRSEGFDLLALIFPDGSVKYKIQDDAHLKFAERIGQEVDREALRRMPISQTFVF